LCLAFFVLLTIVGFASLYTFRSPIQDLPQDGNMAHVRQVTNEAKGAR
jgi:hypothetical protein